ncbi:ExbD/TolR family protein [Piscinibacter koreensis]|uniref:Biopolymer transporter ExbD n=1 Tax=Piscinibacter koreensis TaxID=2742824 RepID=A0A7Y6NKT8_9BURK|nr:biopolymer transporter ExbD [Schlegelella koreensis]NUZ04944.1 biopolymer transporter ExbD [Schlegelella koreensis]
MALQPGLGDRADDEPEVMLDINTTPLIDVMLVLIIMLIITIPVQLHAVNLNLPSGSVPPPVVQPRVVNVDIDFDGTMLWNGTVLADRGELEARLRTVAAEADQPELHVRPNRLVEYRFVAMVLASAQRIGATKIGIVDRDGGG